SLLRSNTRIMKRKTTESKENGPPLKKPKAGGGDDDGRLWVDNYKPRILTQLVGNGAGLDALRVFLAEFREGQKQRAVCLVGPPGIGKTSAAVLAARTCGYEPVEFNASSVRGKTA